MILDINTEGVISIYMLSIWTFVESSWKFQSSSLALWLCLATISVSGSEPRPFQVKAGEVPACRTVRNENLFGKRRSEINQIKLITPSFCRWWHWLRISLMIETCHLTAIRCFQVMDFTEQGRKDRNRSAKVALHVEERLFSSKSHSSCLELSPFSEVFTSERLVLGGPMAQSTAKRPKRDRDVDTCNILMQW